MSNLITAAPSDDSRAGHASTATAHARDSRLTMAYFNVRSVGQRANEIDDFIFDNKLDALIMTESWLQEVDEPCVQEKFQSEVKAVCSTVLADCPEEELAKKYDSMQQLLDRHAPLKTRCVTERRSAPWVNDNIRSAKLSLAGAYHKYHFCHDKHAFIATDTYFVAIKVFLPRQKTCDFLSCAMTKLLLRQKLYLRQLPPMIVWLHGCCRDKIFLSRQIFVATNTCFVAINYVCCKRVFVATKIILVAGPANNTKRDLRRVERTAHRTKLTVHSEIFVKQCNALKDLHRTAKGDYLCDKIRHCSSIRLCSVTYELMGRTTELKLPSIIPLSDFPIAFSDFMHKKIANIRQVLDSCPIPASFETFAGTVFFRTCIRGFDKNLFQ